MTNNKGGFYWDENVPRCDCRRRNEAGIRHEFLIGGAFVYCGVDGNYWRKLAYVHKHTHIYTRTTVYIFSFPPRVLLHHLFFSPSLPSVCTQCQPVISPCKVSVVRIPVFGYCCLVKHLGRRVGGANSLCFICQVRCCYATLLRVKVKSQGMQPQCCDFIYQLNQFVCCSERATTRKWRGRGFSFFNLFVYCMLILVFEHLVRVTHLLIYGLFVLW